VKSLEEIKKDIESRTSAQVTVEADSFVVPEEKLLEVALFLKGNPDYEMNLLSNLAGVDYTTHLEAVYHLYSTTKKHGPIALKVRTDRETGKIPSVTSVWRSAEFQEREAYDLFGIQFEGHPDLRRILMWEGFQFYPMRKDYVSDDQSEIIEKSSA